MWRSQCYSTSSDSMLSLGLFVYLFLSLCCCDNLSFHSMPYHEIPPIDKVQNKMGAKCCSQYVGRCLNECDISKSKYNFPLTAVRPDYVSFSSHDTPKSSIPQSPPLPYSRRTPPHFMTTNNAEKYLTKGYAGNRFFTFPQFGHTSKVDSYHALCDFTNGYQFTKSSEFAPIPFYHASLDGERPGAEIFPRNTGLMPSYKGHVPGLKHSYGKTFGNESVNAKRNLQNSSICSH